MKIYTRTGDDGTTGLFGGPRARKDAPRIESYGAVDELNSVLGLARSAKPPAEFDRLLERLQNELFELGAELASPNAEKMGTATLGDEHVERLEKAIDHFEAQVEPLRQFVLPGGVPAAAWLHLARTVCRRAERRVVALASCPGEHVSRRSITYLNRLSDLLFVMARAVNAAHGAPDVPWRGAGT